MHASMICHIDLNGQNIYVFVANSWCFPTFGDKTHKQLTTEFHLVNENYSMASNIQKDINIPSTNQSEYDNDYIIYFSLTFC